MEKRKSQVHIPEIEVAAKPPAEAAKVVQDVRKVSIVYFTFTTINPCSANHDTIVLTLKALK